MFDQRFVWTGAAVAVIAVLSFFIAKPAEDAEIRPITEPVSGIERAAELSAPDAHDYAYIIREHEGRVAVYPAGADEPEIILDVYVKYLPDYDRSQMAQGIQVKDYTQLMSLLEDYTS